MTDLYFMPATVTYTGFGERFASVVRVDVLVRHPRSPQGNPIHRTNDVLI